MWDYEGTERVQVVCGIAMTFLKLSKIRGHVDELFILSSKFREIIPPHVMQL